jgi:hypothetical protein
MSFQFKTLSLSVLAAAALVACGGGGGDAAVTPTAPPTVAQGVTATLAALGNPPAVTATNTTSTAYDLVAAIGDTWRVNFDSNGNAYSVSIVQTQYGLTNSSTGTTGTFTKTTSGNYTTYTLGTAGTLIVDDRTKAVSGNMTIGAKASTVAGTGYAAPALNKLAGTYNFAYHSRNALDGLSPDMGAGQFTVSADGANIAICPGGTINAAATACTPQRPNSPSVPVAGTLEKASDGLIMITLTENGRTAEFGKLHVLVGDRGPILLIDHYGLNAENVLRTGAFYAAKAVAATGTEFNGNWSCNRTGGIPGSTAVVSGNTAQVTDPGLGVVTENLYYNQVYNSNTQQTLSLPGFLSIGTSLVNSDIVLVLSSSLAVAQGGLDGTDLAVCHRTN